MGSFETQPALTGALGNHNRLKLGTFSTNLHGGGAITALPGILTPTWPEVADIGRLADGMGLELFVPVARWRGYGGATNYASASFDTFCWAAGLAGVTTHASIFSTCHVPTMHPIVAAKQLTTIDHISNGRAGLNTVGGWFRPELEMFGRPLLEHDRRYDMADEWTEILLRLWTESKGFDVDGEFFTVKDAISDPKPVQRPRPPLMNAGGSGRGREYAARFADIAFIHVQDDTDLLSAGRQVEQLKSLAREKYGRELQVWTQGYVICADTDREARAFWTHYVKELGDLEAANQLMHYIGVESAVLGEQNFDRARDRFMSGWGGVDLVGSPQTIAGRLGELSQAGCDGCLLLTPRWQEGLSTFRDRVLPLLEAAQLREPFRPDGEGEGAALASDGTAT
jgi:FMNH2-dependent dimethyl sulfone monooxygenase